ncbi:MAG TPA: hydantoinase B/oxoprolinase family protein [Nitrososphaerales archaeon]|nr:hydantoinase B/oxoprolinase family protein [Nitrososphaerales archaeon]
MSLDKATATIIRNRFFRIIEEGMITLKNVSGSATTTEVHDLMVALYRPNGDLLAGGVGFSHHLTSAMHACKHIIEEYGDNPGISKDDMFILNDPHSGALHTSDAYMISPIHGDDEQIVGWSANFVHLRDVGAFEPGGFSTTATEKFHEGFSSPGVKLVDGGVVRKDILKTILNMVRDPDMVALDLHSQIAANNTIKKRMLGLTSRYGFESVNAVAESLIQQSDMLLRKRLRELPDGIFRARQYLDWGGQVHKINLAMTKQGETLTFDFSGTAKQTPGGFNATFWGTYGATFGPVFPLLCHDMPWNQGITKSVEVIVPEGSILNALPPTTVCNATIGACVFVYNAVIEALSRMLYASDKYRNEATAVWNGSHSNPNIFGYNREGRYFVDAVADGAGGSGGARIFKDGAHIEGEVCNLMSRMPNVEMMELVFPILYLFRRLSKNSAGAGKYRGGLPPEFAITPYDNQDQKIGVVIAGNGTRSTLTHGLFGYPGSTVQNIVVRANIMPEELLKSDQLQNMDFNQLEWPSREEISWGESYLRHGDFLYIRYEGAGGFGDPLDRDPELVRQDVIDSVVSRDAARQVYGVYLNADNELTVDRNATSTARRDLIRKRLGKV